MKSVNQLGETEKNRRMLSIILLSYNSGERLNNVYRDLCRILEGEAIAFELVIIDDDSSDNSYEMACRLEENYSNVSSYQLSRNFTSNYAIFAGLSLCKGCCAIPIPDDEQQPYQTIVEMYRLWENGEKLIVPYRTKRNDGIFTNLFSNTFYSIINLLSEVKYPKGGADTFLADREIIDIINNRIHPINTSIMSEVLRLGFDPYFFPYERVKSLNSKSRWTFRKKFNQAKNTFFSSSTWPVRIITILGIFFSLFALLMILFYSYVRIFGNSVFWGAYVPGWTSTVIIISFFSGLILFSLGIIAEYIWRIYEEVKNRPGYIVKDKPKT